jgi:hypothetical protein
MSDDPEITNFEKLAARTKEQLIAGKDKSMEWLGRAVDASAEQLEKAGEFSKEEGERARQFLKRDLAATRVDFTRARAFVNKGLDPSRVGGGFVNLASHLFGSMGDMFQGWAAKSEEALAYNTGEISGPGLLTCTDCGAELHLERPSRIPPCPKCHKTDFRKSY